MSSSSNPNPPKPSSPSPTASPQSNSRRTQDPPPAPPDNHLPPDVQLNDGDIIDKDIFEQIRELDEEDDCEFSKGMVWAYFSQVSETFSDMDTAFKAKDLAKLSSLGHFLKGSSAALGVTKVQLSCEKIQHYGDLRDEEAGNDLSPEEAITKIGITLKRVKLEYAVAETWLKDFYRDLEASIA